MTDLFAVYWLWIFGVIFLIVAFYFKWALLFIAAGLCWTLVAIYNLTSAGDTDSIFVWAFGMFATIMAIGSFLSTIYARKKFVDSDTPATSSEYDDIIDKEAIDARIARDEARNRGRKYQRDKYK